MQYKKIWKLSPKIWLSEVQQTGYEEANNVHGQIGCKQKRRAGRVVGGYRRYKGPKEYNKYNILMLICLRFYR